MKNLFEKLVRTARTVSILACATGAMFWYPTAQAENGVSDTEIVLGQTTALTGPLAELGLDSSASARAYFDYINQQGGVHGRKIRLITLDDGYDTEKGLANARRLIEKDKVFALFNVISTPTNVALLPIISAARIPNIAPYTGAEALRQPFNRLIFHVRASYNDEIEKIVEHFGIRGIGKVAVVYQNNGFGKAGLLGVEQALERRKLKVMAAAPIESDASDAAAAARALAAVSPQAIVMITAGKPSAEFVKAYNSVAVGMQFFTISVMGSQASIQALGPSGAGVVVSQVGPFPFSATSQLVREYQQIMARMGIRNLSFASMEGFIDAKVAVEGLRRAGRFLSRDSFIAAMETMNDVDLGGYIISFSKDSHEGSRFVDLTVISRGGRFLR
jgi:branched-chain amino acid transport system substrate-binding protein